MVTRLLMALSSLVLKNLKYRDCTTPLDDLFRCFTVLMIKKFPLISSLDLSCFSLCPVKIRELNARIRKENELRLGMT